MHERWCEEFELLTRQIEVSANAEAGHQAGNDEAAKSETAIVLP
jgi:hypothetical protein